MAAAERLHFTGDDEADRFLVAEPLGLLVGFGLDQQVPLQRAFAAPLELKRRLGAFEAGAIAALDPAVVEEAFRRRPALHRFPGTMAQRTQAVCALVAERYGGDAERLWAQASDARELEGRLYDLPGFGEMKVRSLLAVLVKRLGVRPPGWEEVLPAHPTLGDVDCPEALASCQAAKRAQKAAARAAGGG